MLELTTFTNTQKHGSATESMPATTSNKPLSMLFAASKQPQKIRRAAVSPSNNHENKNDDNDDNQHDEPKKTIDALTVTDSTWQDTAMIRYVVQINLGQDPALKYQSSMPLRRCYIEILPVVQLEDKNISLETFFDTEWIGSFYRGGRNHYNERYYNCGAYDFTASEENCAACDHKFSLTFNQSRYDGFTLDTQNLTVGSMTCEWRSNWDSKRYYPLNDWDDNVCMLNALNKRLENFQDSAAGPIVGVVFTWAGTLAASACAVGLIIYTVKKLKRSSEYLKERSRLLPNEVGASLFSRLWGNDSPPSEMTGTSNYASIGLEEGCASQSQVAPDQATSFWSRLNPFS